MPDQIKLWYSNCDGFLWKVSVGGRVYRFREVLVRATGRTVVDTSREPRAWIEFEDAVLGVYDGVGVVSRTRSGGAG